MDTTTLTTRANGQQIVASWFNQIKTLLGTAVDYVVVATEAIGASGEISSSANIKQIRRVAGNAGAQTASNTPFGTTTTNFVDGMEITLIGTDNTNTLTINAVDTAWGVQSPTGTIVLGQYYAITYICDTTAQRFIEKSRNS